MIDKNIDSLFNALKQLWSHISSVRKSQFLLVILLSFLTSIAELLSIGAALPFISVLTDPESLYKNNIANSIFVEFGMYNSSEVILPITLLFVTLVCISTAMRLMMIWANNKWVFNTSIDISERIFDRVIHQSYIFHTKNNSSDIINLIYNKVSEIIFFVIMPSIVLLTSGIMSLVISIALLYFMPTSVTWVILSLVISYVLIMKFVKNRLLINGKIVAEESTLIVKIVQESLGGIRDILIDRTQPAFIESYEKSVKALRLAQAENQILSTTPKFILEATGLLFVAFFAYSLSINSLEKTTIVPILVGIVLSIQRLLPLFQQVFSSWSQMNSARASLTEVIEYLDLPKAHSISSHNSMNFNTSICLRNLTFQYNPSSSKVLESINLTIPKGSTVGFIGATGSGKSTLIDIIMGLLEPSNGSIQIDGVTLNKDNIQSWQDLISHVPQSIYLVDNTIERNIAFGINECDIDKNLVREAAEMAQISSVIEGMPDGYNTVIGERGVQLSGGQRQRLGLARALYKKAKVIILDEATSALDTETERNVIQSFSSFGSDITLIMVAHRISTLANCTKIIELKNGNIFREVKYGDLN